MHCSQQVLVVLTNAFTRAHDYGVYRFDKTAELSQRRPRDAPNMWVPWKVLRVLTTHPATVPEICNGLLFRSILRIVRTKFEVRSFTRSWDNRGYSKNLGSPWIRPRWLFSQIFKGLLFAWTLWIYLTNEFRSFTPSWDNRGTHKN